MRFSKYDDIKVGMTLRCISEDLTGAVNILGDCLYTNVTSCGSMPISKLDLGDIELVKFVVDCPDCVDVEDDQYTCTSCWCDGGNGKLDITDSYIIKRIVNVDDGRFKQLFDVIRLSPNCLECSTFNTKLPSVCGFRCRCSPSCIGATLRPELMFYIQWMSGFLTSDEYSGKVKGIIENEPK